MADTAASFLAQPRVRIGLGVIVLAAAGIGVWAWSGGGHISTDDAQVEAHVTQVAPRVGGTVLRIAVADNQTVEAGAVLVELDPRDYQAALDKARAELADADATAAAAQRTIPITSTQTTGHVATARSGLARSAGAITAAEREVEAARARLTTAEARLREAEANATRTTRDVERLRGLLAKDEVSQQQFDMATATAEAQRAGVDSARSQIVEANAGIRVAESRLQQARAAEQQAQSELRTVETIPDQVGVAKARAQAADARVQQMRAALTQAELNLQYTTLRAPAKGVVSRKSVEVGQIVQGGQPLMALIALDGVWITANFKETQLAGMRPGQKATVSVDAYPGQSLTGRVDSVAAATGARFSLLPPENATGNYVKVVQRVPVKIVLDPGQDPEHRLRPGLSVVPTVHTK